MRGELVAEDGIGDEGRFSRCSPLVEVHDDGDLSRLFTDSTGNLSATLSFEICSMLNLPSFALSGVFCGRLLSDLSGDLALRGLVTQESDV